MAMLLSKTRSFIPGRDRAAYNRYGSHSTAEGPVVLYPECRGSNRPRIGRSIKSGTIQVIIRLLMTLTRRNEFERARRAVHYKRAPFAMQISAVAAIH